MSSATRILGLKVDVDTRRGMERGVPSLLDALTAFRVPATFFLSFGPDNSGKAVYQLLRNPRFLVKMLRTNAPGLYGFRTALYGTLLADRGAAGQRTGWSIPGTAKSESGKAGAGGSSSPQREGCCASSEATCRKTARMPSARVRDMGPDPRKESAGTPSGCPGVSAQQIRGPA